MAFNEQIMDFYEQVVSLAKKVERQASEIPVLTYDPLDKERLKEQSRLLADNAAMLAEWCAKPIGV